MVTWPGRMRVACSYDGSSLASQIKMLRRIVQRLATRRMPQRALVPDTARCTRREGARRCEYNQEE